MKSITIVFSKAITFFPIFSWLIMLAEGTPFSHVAIKMLDEETGVMMYYQASHTQVNAMTEATWLTQETIIFSFTFNVDDSIAKNAKAFALKALGIPYGVLGICGLAIVQLAKFVHIKMHNPFKEIGATYWCSAFVAAIVENVKELQTKENLNDMTPADLLPMIKSLPTTWTATT